jgi:hypothetical protein
MVLSNLYTSNSGLRIKMLLTAAEKKGCSFLTGKEYSTAIGTER